GNGRMGMGPEPSSTTASAHRVFDAKPTITESTASATSGTGLFGVSGSTTSTWIALGPTLAPIAYGLYNGNKHN
ncbi:hypothetical protein FRC11_001712, partial [Ceratobasidium sp. 423]